MRSIVLIVSLFFYSCAAYAKQIEIDPQTVKSKTEEIMKAHASFKKLTPLLINRTLQNFIDELDPNKIYFIKSDVERWINPSDTLLNQVLNEYEEGKFPVFEEIHHGMIQAIQRRHELEKKIDLNDLPKHVNSSKFKELGWAENEEELLVRLTEIKALQMEGADKLDKDFKEKSLQRIAKRQAKLEEEIMTLDESKRKQWILSTILKAFASSLDSHTTYFTPAEATQFMINVQQRLFGIGAQLRDDINGFTITKIIEGGPAAQGKQLKVKDRIIAVDGEPVVGMEIEDAVELIRGKESTVAVLTVIRESGAGNEKREETLDIKVLRGEVVLKESRFETSFEPFGDGAIGYIKLYSFYQDIDSSSGEDLARAIQKVKAEQNLKGIILDLRYNSGGLLSQAVAVTGLFISKGIVVSVKDDTGDIQHLRDFEGKKEWGGPLIILINRASASASEIVAQTLQDYGRALIVGDDHSFGKGSFQTFTLSAMNPNDVNDQGEYKVTRGRYYTVSGKTPQLVGVQSDIVVPGALSEMEIGEKYAKYPLDNDQIKDNFEDDLSDVPFLQRKKIESLYKFNLQPKLAIYQPFIDQLKKNSSLRISLSDNYQNFLKEVKRDSSEENDAEGKDENAEDFLEYGQNDLQLMEAYNIMKDIIFLMQAQEIAKAA